MTTKRERREIELLARLDPDLAERYAARMTPPERIERVERETAGLDKSPMTDWEKGAVWALSLCSMRPGSYEKRFSRDMLALRNTDYPELTEGQRRYLWKLVYRFRRQIGERSELVKMAEEHIR